MKTPKKRFRKTVSLVLGLLITTIATLLSCSSDDGGGSGVDNNIIMLAEIPQDLVMGWGKGRANADGYLSLSIGDGQIQTFAQIGDNDEDTQRLVDIVFPGDWGSQGGGITICAPNEGGAGGASWEYCTNWIRKKGTQIAEMPNSFDFTAFENVKSVQQILNLDANAYYTGWYYPGVSGSGQGKTYLIRTYEGYLALIYLKNVQGTYGDTYAKVTLRIKLTKEAY